MSITFTTPKPEPAPSLACRLGVEGAVRFRELSACKLTFEDNPSEHVEVWVAEKPRTAVLEVSDPDYVPDTRFVPVY